LIVDKIPVDAEHDVTEYFDTPKELKKKIKQLTKWISSSKHFVSFTGAGVSTSAGIPDYRGPQGAWTLRDQGALKRDDPVTDMVKAMPTPTHMSLVELQSRGILKYLISQNCDGLHRKSGIRPELISELHGNANKEVCSKCGREYLRDFDACATYKFTGFDHSTGRICAVPDCEGVLKDTIINFGEFLPQEIFQRAKQNSKEADLFLVLGSSLTVSPARDLPFDTLKNKGKLVICNLQATPLDKYASLIIHARCDEVMQGVMEALKLAIPPFILHRHLQISHRTTEEKSEIQVVGVDLDGIPASFLKAATIKLPWRPPRGQYLSKEPIKIVFETSKIPVHDQPTSVGIDLHFMGNYNEPDASLTYSIRPAEEVTKKFTLDFDPQTGYWTIIDSDGKEIPQNRQEPKEDH